MWVGRDLGSYPLSLRLGHEWVEGLGLKVNEGPGSGDAFPNSGTVNVVQRTSQLRPETAHDGPLVTSKKFKPF